MERDYREQRKDREMPAIKIYDIEQRQFVSVLKDCHLCDSSFAVPIESDETICPKCKELWKRFVADREISLNIKINKDID